MLPPAPAARAVAMDGSHWEDMSIEEQDAAMLIGYDQLSWDEGEVPQTCTHPWLRLSTVEQTAARLLGYTQATWDTELDATTELAPQPPAPLSQEPPPSQRPPTSQAQPAAPQLWGAAPPAVTQPALAPVAGNSEDHAWAMVSSNNRHRGGGNKNRDPAPSAGLALTTLPRFDAGMMFGCTKDTYDENMSRRLFGLPESNFRVAQKITDTTALFLFNYSTKQLHGAPCFETFSGA